MVGEGFRVNFPHQGLVLDVPEVLCPTLRAGFPSQLLVVPFPLDEAGAAVVLATTLGQVRVSQDVQADAALILGVHLRWGTSYK